MNTYILNYKRTPIGSFLSNYKNTSINDLSKQCLDNLLHDFDKKLIDKIYIGNVLSSGLGQNIARQIGLENDIDVPSITVNNVCGSGLLSIIEGHKSILLGESDCVLVGGVELMSNSPHICNIRNKKYGDTNLIDTMLCDGLIDSFTKQTMTNLSENICKKLNITREDYDEYSINMYKRSRYAINNNKFFNEITPIKLKNGKIINEDEEINKVNDLNKIKTLKSINENGISTPANISKLSDGVAFIVLISDNFVKKHNIKPKFKIINYDLTVCSPEEAPICNTYSIKNIIKKNNLKINDIDIFEINDAFPLCSLHAIENIPIDHLKINKYGSAISLGHPLGCSGTRIVCTLLNILNNENKTIGCASIANGGGGSTSILIKSIH